MILRNVKYIALLVIASVTLALAKPTAVNYIIAVYSINDPAASPRRNYVLLSSKPGVDITNAEFKKYAGYFRQVLEKQKFSEAARAEDADVAIFINYGIGDPKTAESAYSLPPLSDTGSSAMNLSLKPEVLTGDRFTLKDTDTTGQEGIFSDKNYPGNVQTYLRYFILDAMDLTIYTRSKDVVPLWRTTLISRGQTEDLAAVSPYMVTASNGYIGENLVKPLLVNLKENDPWAKYLRESEMQRETSVLQKVLSLKSGTPVIVKFNNGDIVNGIYLRTNNDIIVIKPNNKPEKAFDQASLKDIEIQGAK